MDGKTGQKVKFVENKRISKRFDTSSENTVGKNEANFEHLLVFRSIGDVVNHEHICKVAKINHVEMVPHVRIVENPR